MPSDPNEPISVQVQNYPDGKVGIVVDGLTWSVLGSILYAIQYPDDSEMVMAASMMIRLSRDRIEAVMDQFEHVAGEKNRKAGT